MDVSENSGFSPQNIHFNRGNRDPLMVLEESRYVCRYVLTFFGDWLVHASDVMVAMDENMYD